jgi:hypothetical protein
VMDKEGSRDVDAYIASAPAAAQPHLRTLRAIVKSEAPSAEGQLSYDMPHHDHHGRLRYFVVNKAPSACTGSSAPAMCRTTSGNTSPPAARSGSRSIRALPIAALHAAVRARVDQNEALALANSRRPAR